MSKEIKPSCFSYKLRYKDVKIQVKVYDYSILSWKIKLVLGRKNGKMCVRCQHWYKRGLGRLCCGVCMGVAFFFLLF